MRRFFFFLLCYRCLAPGLPGQGAAPAPAVATAVIAPPVSAWEHTETVRTSLGWRDNILLSPYAPIARTFGRAEVEAFVSRAGRDWQLLSFVSGDVLRYFSPPAATGGEQQWFGQGELRWQRWPAWRLALKAGGFLQDAVIDLSETEAIRTVAPVRVRGGMATLAPRVQLPGRLVLEPLFQVKRTDYREFAGDYDETKTGARLEWKLREVFGVSAAWYEHRRGYAVRPQYTAGGRARANTRLHFLQHAAEIKVSAGWTRAGTWQAAATAGRLENRDGSSGFFDYDQQRARLELTWERAGWKIGCDSEAKRMDYLLQTVGAGTAPPARIADSYETSLQVERELAGGWALVLQHRWERNRSNEAGFSYRANTVLAGLQRTY